VNNLSTAGVQVVALLEGAWEGEGRGEYPTVQSFDYHETLIFTHRDQKTLAYEQRSQKRYDGQTEYLVSHWENGFIRVLENDALELVNIQSSGRVEVLAGTIETRDHLLRIIFVSKAIINDSRLVSSARTFELEGDTLRYEMAMQTKEVNQLTHHLKINLHRSK
jgi:hypothetical protein